MSKLKANQNDGDDNLNANKNSISELPLYHLDLSQNKSVNLITKNEFIY